MKLNLKLLIAPLTIDMLFSMNTYAQLSCCNGEKQNKKICTTDLKDRKDSSCYGTTSKSDKAASGCQPSSCRGAKTKFGEAKVISNLRTSLVVVKAKMEKSKSPKFAPSSYDVHGIVGKTDEESLQIIVKELKLMEKEFSNKTPYKPLAFLLPENKAKQIKYLEDRIESLNKFL